MRAPDKPTTPLKLAQMLRLSIIVISILNTIQYFPYNTIDTAMCGLFLLMTLGVSFHLCVFMDPVWAQMQIIPHNRKSCFQLI